VDFTVYSSRDPEAKSPFVMNDARVAELADAPDLGFDPSPSKAVTPLCTCPNEGDQKRPLRTPLMSI